MRTKFVFIKKSSSNLTIFNLKVPQAKNKLITTIKSIITTLNKKQGKFKMARMTLIT